MLQQIIRSALAIVLLNFTTAGLPAQTTGRLSAREIFYSPPPAEAAAKKRSARQPAKPKEKPPAETARAKPAAPKSNSDRPAGDLMEVAYNPAEAAPLGLRYSILKRHDSGFLEVNSDTIFHSGDRIRVRVDVNTPGYLYIVSRGSSGNWKPLFPSPEIAGGDNRVRNGVLYEIPHGYVFTFDEQPGKEMLFLVFSRQPVNDLEDLIYSLSKEQKTKPKENKTESKMLLAQANVSDGMIDRLRSLAARDLIIEKVDDSVSAAAPSAREEKAVYVVNPSRLPNARVVADITLAHE